MNGSLFIAGPGTDWFNTVLGNILNKLAWPIFVAAVVIMFIWAGILFLMSQGDPSKISAAKSAVIWAVVGIFVGIIAFSAVNIIQSIIIPAP